MIDERKVRERDIVGRMMFGKESVGFGRMVRDARKNKGCEGCMQYALYYKKRNYLCNND